LNKKKSRTDHAIKNKASKSINQEINKVLDGKNSALQNNKKDVVSTQGKKVPDKFNMEKAVSGKGRHGEDLELINGRENMDSILAIILLAAMLLIPLAVRVHTGMFIAPHFVSNLTNSGIKSDIFSYYMAGLLYFAAILVVIIMLVKVLLYKWRIEPSYINLPIIILVLVIILSGLFADFKAIALAGTYDRHQGALTYVCFLVLFFAAATARFKPWFLRSVIWIVGLVATVNTILILFHFFNHDLYHFAWFQSLLAPFGQKGPLEPLTVWSTFTNPNYISGIGAGLAVFFFTLTLKVETAKHKIAMGTMAVSAFILMTAAFSSSGWVALILSLPLAIILGLKGSDSRMVTVSALVVLSIFTMVLVGMNKYDPKTLQEPSTTIVQAWQDIFEKDQATGSLSSSSSMANSETRKATAISTTDEFNLPPAGISAGSGRIYIWDKTIKLIKKRPLFGYGLNTLPYYFPQDDIMNVTGLGTYQDIVDKPHSFYLEIAYGSGLIALLSMLSLFILFFCKGLTYCWQAGNSKSAVYHAAIITFFVAFILQWLFNDSIISTSAIFWIMAGIGVSLQRDG